ncbi:MAG: PD40 domain-containing protein, partial [Deltaproteobacteria bacterium]|nr:PD40 domain-containing protein [Deltaproteobacteria bacterium]
MKKFTILTTFLLFLSTVNAFADIAFVANVDGNWDLFTVDDEGRNPVRLTDTPYDEKDPTWSSDRKKIVYATTDGYLNLIDADTKEKHQIAINERNTPKVCPCFSPDGKQIAYAQFRPPGSGDDTDLMTFNFETNATSRVLDQYALQMWPDWSPNGRRLVYINAHCSGDCGRMIQELWIADQEGGWARQLLLTNSFCQQPAWSPDGRQVAFSSDKSGNFDIWVIS